MRGLGWGERLRTVARQGEAYRAQSICASAV
jgi:hypothetical protein